VGFLNLKDYESPRSPNPLRYLTTAKSVIILAFKPLAGAYRYGEIPGARCPHFFMLWNRRAIRLPIISRSLWNATMEQSLFSSRLIGHSKSMRKHFVLHRKRFAPACSGSKWIGGVGKNTLALTKEYGPA